ncbi:heavy metal translocating P-type ATPase [Paenibacillus terrigena]|uniref:heavy metal translocating P-type ATPase n=1 Tax=Paenibacillus terrigena TaxID=369333 RepID=UPI000361DE18|nr:cation-translocating P-type ATPase [Paenibacillus terrigena]
MNTQIQLQITGMTCAACSARIERTLRKLPGVDTVSVNLPFGQAHVELDPNVIQVHQITEKIQQIGYGVKEELEDAHTHASNDIRFYRNRFVASALMSIPLFWVMFSHFTWMPSIEVPALIASPWTQLLIGTILQFLIGFPFYYGAYKALIQRSANMDVLVALSTTMAYLYSHYLIFNAMHTQEMHHTHYYFDTSAMIFTAVLLGKWLESIAKGKALKGMSHMQSLQARMIRLLDGTQERCIPVEDLSIGATVIVYPGEVVSVDGKLIRGLTEVDESFLTGESKLVQKSMGDMVYNGSKNVSGLIHIRTAVDNANSQLSRMIQLVEQAQHSKPLVQRQVDRLAALFVPAMILCGAITFLIWNYMILPGNPEMAWHHAMAVLLVSCPCALGLATPISILITSSLSARRGILFKEGKYIESLYRMDCFLLDKTGTLTEGKPSVQAIDAPGQSENYILRIAAALERYSAHPLAQAIVTAAEKKQLLLPEASAVTEIASQGIMGCVEGIQLHIGKESWLQSMDISVPGALKPRVKHAGETRLHVALHGVWKATIYLSDPIRSSSSEGISLLKKHGTVMMVTGDEQAVAADVAGRTGIEYVYAGMLPADKLQLVNRLQSEGRRVAMIGDGVNDTAALTAADIGIAMDSGTRTAIEAGDVVLLRGDLTHVPAAIQLSRNAMRNIRQNLGFSLAYNMITIPMAAAGFLEPMTACVLMAFSSVTVVCNALRLTKQLKH